jgi:hypothetical protein
MSHLKTGMEALSLIRKDKAQKRVTELLQLCVNDMYSPSGKISISTARKLVKACADGVVKFPK